MNTIFYQKYIDTKMKYTRLNKLFGGDPSNITPAPTPAPAPAPTPAPAPAPVPMVTSILATHNGRIRCLLNSLNINSHTNAKFKNCAVLKLIITQNSLSVKLMHDGELNTSGDKDKYFSTSGTTDEIFHDHTTTNEQEFTQILQKLNMNQNDFGDIKKANHTFYIVRHGDGEHNEAKASGTKINKTILGLLTDAKLTEIGKLQAINAGYALLEDLQNTKVNYLFASDLIRTRQTLKSIYDIIKSKLAMQNEKVYIVPCSHELDFKKTKTSSTDTTKQNCDARQKILAQENIMSCKDFSKPYCAHTDGLYNDWGYYWRFYGEGSRSHAGRHKQRCRDTSVIKQMLNIMNAR
jgi:broad specificity phosphatase PhoE